MRCHAGSRDRRCSSRDRTRPKNWASSAASSDSNRSCTRHDPASISYRQPTQRSQSDPAGLSDPSHRGLSLVPLLVHARHRVAAAPALPPAASRSAHLAAAFVAPHDVFLSLLRMVRSQSVVRASASRCSRVRWSQIRLSSTGSCSARRRTCRRGCSACGFGLSVPLTPGPPALPRGTSSAAGPQPSSSSQSGRRDTSGYARCTRDTWPASEQKWAGSSWSAPCRRGW